MGINKIEYEKPQVAFYDVDYQNGSSSEEIPTEGENTTIVSGIYFSWSIEGGFTNVGWFLASNSDGPTKHFGFTSDEEVREHIQEHGDLDLVFQEWQRYIDDLDPFQQNLAIGLFGQEIDAAGGGKNGNNCMVEASI